MLDTGNFTLLNPPTMEILAGTDPVATLEWIHTNYIPNHHWYGTNRAGPDARAGAVVDSAGRVHGVKGLRVADASVFPVKPDGNTQVPAYLVGAIVVDKILRGE